MFKKIKNFVSGNILFIETLVILAFIPLYPKIPLLDVRNTWVYVRFEDFLVLFVLLSWLALLIRKKVNFKTPLTLPIIAFWLVGAISTLHGVLIIFPSLTGVFPNVAFLAYIRHIEYLSVFFVAYFGIKDKTYLKSVIWTLIITFVGVTLYGFGQKYGAFPAYLTMNEEFAKGSPIYLSGLSRISSTFAGHYDLAAYLVLMIPILASLFFGFKNLFIKIFLVIISLAGLVLLYFTVSRVSFLVLFISLAIVLFFQKRKLLLVSIPVILLIGSLFIALHPSSLLDRFKSTVANVDVVLDANTGQDLGHVVFVNRDYFNDKIVLQKRVKDPRELAIVLSGQDKSSTISAVYPQKYIPLSAPLVTAINVSNGETLPSGTQYINLPLSPVTQRIESFFYELPPNLSSSSSGQVLVIQGDFVVKKAGAYDLSLTTRTQGEWPRAIEAFQKNILIGSGYDSVTLAVDNNYLRILAETGLLGFLAFMSFFFVLAVYIKNIFRDIDSPVTKSFIIGFGAGVIGLLFNAALIDVFEASKVAFVLWTLFGVTFGVLSYYKKKEIDIVFEAKKAASSDIAIIVYLILLCIVLLSPAISNFFVADDFKWLRWAADCTNNCDPISRAISYFTSSDSFFYRPGTKLYFYFMYSRFWLNQDIYHLVSIFIHFLVAVSFFFLAKRVTRDRFLAFLSAVIFLVMSGFSEVIFWISSIGYEFSALFGILSVLLFAKWEEKTRKIYLALSVLSISISLMFHEMGVIYPLIIVGYSMLFGTRKVDIKKSLKRVDYWILFIPDVFYLILRFLSNSHWSGGDYSYNLLKLPLNFVGNIIGYAGLIITGPISLSVYEMLRNLMRSHVILAILAIPIIILAVFACYKIFVKTFDVIEKKIVIFGIIIFVVSLLPFLGLGNIASRYSYFASLGVILILVVLFKKTYKFLEVQGKEISIGIMSLLLLIFILFHIIQVQQSYFEWQDAGNRVQKFFISFEASYKNYWQAKDAKFYFVDVPVKLDDAWVFPVGLDDAVWFAIRNQNAQIITNEDLDTSLKDAGYYQASSVFKFNEDGSVTEINRLLNVPDDLIIPAGK